MKTLKIIDSLYLTENGVRYKARNGRYQQVHLRQGELDGACAIYSACMALILIGVVKYNDITVYGKNYKKSTAIERLKKEFFDKKGMHRDGNYFDELKRSLKKGYAKNIVVDHIDDSDELETIQKIDETINNNLPVVISCEFSGGAHALIAIGMEYDVNNEACRILCLDPDTPEPKISYYNCVIDLNVRERGIYIHNYFNTKDNFVTKVLLGELLIITKR
jgi:hypothetical protein